MSQIPPGSGTLEGRAARFGPRFVTPPAAGRGRGAPPGGFATPAGIACAAPALAAALLLACWLVRESPQPAGFVPMEGWGVPELAARLQEAGLGVSVIDTQPGQAGRNAFLTTDARGWADFNGLHMVPEKIDRWRGAAYVEVGRTGEEGVRLWGDCGLVAGPFTFFGDPDLLARIRAALTVPTPPGRTEPPGDIMDTSRGAVPPAG